MIELLEQKLADAVKELKAVKAKIREDKRKVQTMPLTIGEVFPGDVWVLPKNKGYRHGYFCKVVSVDKEKNTVNFEDGWNPLDNMLTSGEWVLVSRELNPVVKKKAKSL